MAPGSSLRRECVLCYLDRVNMSYAIVPMSEQFGWGPSEKGAMLSAFFWGYVASQWIGASASSAYGAKRVLGFATLGWSVVTACLPLATSLRAFIVMRVALGLFEGVTFPTIYHFFANWVTPGARSRAIGSLQIGNQAGTIAAAILCPAILDSPSLGWKYIFYLFSLVGLAWCVLWSLKGIDPIKANESPTASTSLANTASVKTMLRMPGVRAICVCHFCYNYIHYLLISWLPTYYHDVLGVAKGSLWLTVVPFLSMAICAQIACYWADSLIVKGMSKLEVRQKFTAFGFCGAGIGLLVFPTFTSPAAATIVAVVSLGCLSPIGWFRCVEVRHCK